MLQDEIALIKIVVHQGLNLLWPFPIAWLVMSGLAIYLGRSIGPALKPRSWFLSCLSAVVLTYGFIFCIAYLNYPTFTDQVEATIAGNSAYLMHGRPLYHLPASDEWYSIVYGPWLFIAVEGAYRVFGQSILSSKIPGIGCFVAAIAIFGAIAQQRWGARRAVLAAALLCAVVVIYGPFVLSNRGDAFFVLSATIGLTLLWTPHRLCAMLLLGIMAGISAGIKFHGFAYLLPAGIAVSHGLGKRWGYGWLIFGSAALLLFWLPFLSSDLVSWNNLIAHIRLSARHGLDSRLLLLNVQLLGLMLLAVFGAAMLARPQSGLYARAFLTEMSWLLGATALIGVLVLYPASKEGSGPHHLMPLLPYVIYGVFECVRRASFSTGHGLERRAIVLEVASGFAAICLVVGAANWHYRVGNLVATRGIAVLARAEVEELATNLPQGAKVIMAFGDRDSYWSTWYRPILVFRSHPIGVDPVTAMDLRKAGLPLPSSYLKCDGNDNSIFGWIIPKSGPPLSMESYYMPYDRIADTDTVLDFRKRAEITIETRYYTFWQCRR